jgi:hypothetical protein
MPISIPAFSFYLLLIGSARAGVSAPNCTDNVFAWVGSILSDAQFGSITICSSHRPGVLIDVQFASTKPLLGRSVLGSGV